MVNDDKVAEAGEGIGERDRPRMDRVYRATLERRDFDPVSDHRVVQAPGWLPE